MTKPNFKKWEAEYRHHKISVTKWFWSFQGSADLYINDELVDSRLFDSSGEAFHDINKPLLKAYEYNETIESLEVFITGTFSEKVSIMVNGESIYQVRLTFLDRLMLHFFRDGIRSSGYRE